MRSVAEDLRYASGMMSVEKARIMYLGLEIHEICETEHTVRILPAVVIDVYTVDGKLGISARRNREVINPNLEISFFNREEAKKCLCELFSKN